MDQAHDEASCADAVERLYFFLDGELDDDRREVIRNHLDDCLPCLEAFDFEAELRQVIARKCTETVPDQLRVRIALAIQQECGPVEGPLGGMHPL